MQVHVLKSNKELSQFASTRCENEQKKNEHQEQIK